MIDNDVRSLRIQLEKLLDDYSDKLGELTAAMEMLVPQAQAVLATGQEPVNQNMAYITSDPTLSNNPVNPQPAPVQST